MREREEREALRAADARSRRGGTCSVSASHRWRSGRRRISLARISSTSASSCWICANRQIERSDVTLMRMDLPCWGCACTCAMCATFARVRACTCPSALRCCDSSWLWSVSNSACVACVSRIFAWRPSFSSAAISSWLPSWRICSRNVSASVSVSALSISNASRAAAASLSSCSRVARRVLPRPWLVGRESKSNEVATVEGVGSREARLLSADPPPAPYG